MAREVRKLFIVKNATKMKSIKNKKPKVIVMSGYGLNCEEETKFAFEWAGAKENVVADIVHINDLIKKPNRFFT